MLQCEVQPGETLVSISIREKVPVVGLRRLNKLYGNEIFPGQILKLRSKVTDSGPIEDSNAFTRQDSHNRVSLDGSDANNTATDDNIVPTQTPPLAPVRTLSFVDNMLDVKTAIATTAGEKLSVMRSMMSSKRIPIDVPEIPARQRSSSSASVASLSLSYGERKSAQSDEELDKVPPILIGKRNILTADQAMKLRRFLPTMQQIESWKLIYSVLNDGADLDSFFRRTKSHKYTLIIVQTINGELFGGFNSMEWMTSPNFYGSGESFLYRFDSEMNLEHFAWTGANDFFVWSGQQQIAMGGGGEGFGFVLDSDFATGESFRSATYGNQILVDREHGSFRIANVECWGFEGIFGVTSKSNNNRKSHS